MAYIKEDCIKSLQHAAHILEHSPSTKEYILLKCRPSIKAIERLYGSFNKAKKAAKLQYWNHRTKEYTDKDLLNNLQYITEDIGHVPTIHEYHRHPLHMARIETIMRRTGKDSWIDVCKLAGLVKENYRGHKTSEHDYEDRRTQILQEIYSLTIEHPDEYITCIIEKYTKISFYTLYRCFGSIDELIKQLNIKYSIKCNKYTHRRIHWNKQIIEGEFKRIEALLGRQPVQSDMKKYSIYKSIEKGIAKIYGSFYNLKITMGYVSRSKKLTPEIKQKRRKLLISTLKRIVKECDTNNWTLKQFVEACHTSQSVIRSVFNNTSEWFIRAKIQVPNRFGGRINQGTITNEQILQSLRETYKYYGHAPSIREYNMGPNKILSKSSIIHRFGSWDNALKAAYLK